LATGPVTAVLGSGTFMNLSSWPRAGEGNLEEVPRNLQDLGGSVTTSLNSFCSQLCLRLLVTLGESNMSLGLKFES
jgi:hypothetical protein